MAFDPNVSYQAGEGTYSINFKIEDQDGNHIWPNGNTDGSIGAYAISNVAGLNTVTSVSGNTGISTEVGPMINWTGATQYTYTSFDYISCRSQDPTSPDGIYQGGFVVTDVTGGDFPNDSNYWYGSLTVAVPTNAAPVQYAFKFKDTNGILYPALVSGVINGITYYKSQTLALITGSILNANTYGGYFDMDPNDTVMPIIFTVDLGGGGGADTEKPVITSLTTGINLVENSGAGQTVYTITATDNVGVTSYAIGGTDASLLTVNASSGVVTLNANPNYETKSSYSFTVTATDGTNTSDPKTVTFTISNANEPTTGKPGITSSGNVSSPLVGDVLTATADNIVDPDGLPSSYTYQWKRAGANISGATSSTYTIVSGDVGSTITVSVSFTDGGGFTVGPLTSDPTGQVTAPNNPATGKPTITGTPALGQTLTATLGDMADIDGLSGPYTYQWKRNGTTNIGTNSTTYTVTSDDVGQTITVTVSFTDDRGNNESRTSDPVTVTALDDKIYFWTEYFPDLSNNIPANSTLIYYGIYNTSKISGVILNYDVSGSTTVPDLSYNEQDQIDNDTMISKKEWPIHVINTRTNASETEPDGVANKQMVFAGAMTQSINGMNMGVFAIVRGNIILKSIAAMVDNNSNFLTPDNKYAIGQPANPPEITEPGGRPLGDINYDGSFNDIDIDIMSAYLLNNTDLSFNVYGGDTSTVLYTNKTAIEIIGTIDTDGNVVTPGLMSAYDILTYIDVNNNNIIDVGDLVRMLSKRANPAFSMTNGS